MLTEQPPPGMVRLQQAADTYQHQHNQHYFTDLLKAHAALGLTRQLSVTAEAGTENAAVNAALAGGDRSSVKTLLGPPSQQQQQQHTAWCFASIVPLKDMEVTVIGRHLCCPAFQKLLHISLRTLIDGCGSRTFNCGVLNLDLSVAAPAGVGLDRQFWGSNNNNNNSPTHRTSIHPLKDEAMATAAALGSANNSVSNSSSDSNSGALPSNSSSDSMCSATTTSSSSSSTRSGGHQGCRDPPPAGPSSGPIIRSFSGDQVRFPDVRFWGSKGPVVARIVSRGKLTSVASDFGCLEVFGGASIGHTDPFVLVEQLDAQLSAMAAGNMQG